MWLALGLALCSKICQPHWRSGTLGTACHNRLSLLMRSCSFSLTNCSDPMGVPNTMIPEGCHAFSPIVQMCSGSTPPFRLAQVQTDACNPKEGSGQNIKNRFHPLRWAQNVDVAQKRAQLFSEEQHGCRFFQAPCMPMEKSKGIRGSPCSPPSACVTMCLSPSSPTSCSVRVLHARDAQKATMSVPQASVPTSAAWRRATHGRRRRFHPR